MPRYVFFLFTYSMFSKINPEHRQQLLQTEADRLYNTTKTRLENYCAKVHSLHHPSKLMPSVSACLFLGPKNTVSIIQLLKLSQLNKVMHVNETSKIFGKSQKL